MQRFLTFSFIAGLLLMGFGSGKAVARLDDHFTLKSISGNQAELQGKRGSLKVGDHLYFPRAPYRFTVTEVQDGKVKIALPAKHDLAEGVVLLREATPLIKKNMETADRLKAALEE